MEKIKSLYNEHKETIIQFLKFGIIGGMNTVLTYLINILCMWIFEKTAVLGTEDLHITLFSKEILSLTPDTKIALAAQFIAFMITVFIGYQLNAKYTFKPNPDVPWWKSMLKVYFSYSITGIFMNFVLIYIQVDLLGISKYIAPLVNLFFTVPTNFLLNKCP